MNTTTSMLIMASRALAALLLALVLLAPGTVRPAYATTITVDTTAEAPGGSGDCTLGEAIAAASLDTAVDACPAGTTEDTIVLPAGATFTLTTGVDTDVGPTAFVISNTVTINGNGATLVRDPGAGSLRFFAVDVDGALTLNDLTLLNGRIVGDDGAFNATGPGGPGDEALGGAIFHYGDVTLAGVTLEGNVAQGGAGSVGGVNGTVGQAGGAGGAARGGAIYGETGALTLEPPGAAFIDNQALGGGGGTGANGDIGGGAGGGGGTASGGAYSGHNLVLAGGVVAFTGNQAQGGAAGSGGATFGIGAAGSGGAGGAAQGGGLAIQTLFVVSAGTATFAGNSATGGAGGGGGFDLVIGGAGGSGGSAAGGGLYAAGALQSTMNSLSFVDNLAAGGAGGLAGSTTFPGGVGGEAKGGGLYVLGDGTLLAAAEFSGNSLAGGHGGGIGAFSAPGGNAHGGAIYAAGSLTVTQSTLVSNTVVSGRGLPATGRGGAIYHEKNSFTLTASVLQFNQAHGAAADAAAVPTGAQGGALYLNDAPTRIARTALIGNAALGGVGTGITGTAQGGAAFIQSGAEFNNVTLSGNSATSQGGGLFAGAVVTLTHATVVSNTVVSGTLSSGGGLTGTVALANSIVADNAVNNCGAEVTDLGGNFQYPGNGCGAGVATADPQLGALELGAGTWFHHPASTSPVLDAAEQAFCAATDQRGVARPVGSGCDSGAIEVFWALWLPLIER